jgi:hypothetical protein
LLLGNEFYLVSISIIELPSEFFYVWISDSCLNLNLSNWVWVWVLYYTADGQSVSLSWNKAPIWGLRPDFYYCQTVAGLLMWGALSDKGMGLSFTIAAGPRQRIYSWVRVPWDSWPYFTVSDSRLPFSSPPTTRRATVEVFDSPPHEYCLSLSQSETIPLVDIFTILYEIMLKQSAYKSLHTPVDGINYSSVRWFYEQHSPLCMKNVYFEEIHKISFNNILGHFQLVPKSRKCGSIHPLPHTSSWSNA